MSGFSGVVDHTIHWQEKVPVGVELLLKRGEVVRIDLVGRLVEQTEGEPLKEKKRAWCLQIGDYLARQALLERQEKATQHRADGRVTLSFEPRPDPRVTWWG